MANKTDAPSAAYKALEAIAERLSASEARRPGAFQFQTTGAEAEDFAIEIDDARKVKPKPGRSDRMPRNLVTGDGKQLRMILEGKRDARVAFLAGAVQFRGDVRYLERVLDALEMMKRNTSK